MKRRRVHVNNCEPCTLTFSRSDELLEKNKLTSCEPEQRKRKVCLRRSDHRLGVQFNPEDRMAQGVPNWGCRVLHFW